MIAWNPERVPDLPASRSAEPHATRLGLVGFYTTPARLRRRSSPARAAPSALRSPAA
jgi:hypothetical protein